MLQRAADFSHADDYGAQAAGFALCSLSLCFGATMLYMLFLLLVILVVAGCWARPLAKVVQQHILNSTIESEQVLLWGGLFLSALSLGLLVLYLFLQP